MPRRSRGEADLEPGGDGLEAAAHLARYRFLRETAERLGARYVVTAHTADDQVETVLHHVLRGTGLAGLAGMQKERALGPAVSLVRPLLVATRREVLDYLATIGQSYREDATNVDRQYTRNAIRHDLLPRLERDFGPSVRDSLLRLASVAGDAQRFIEKAAEQLLDRCLVNCSASGVRLTCDPLMSADRHLVREMFVALWRAGVAAASDGVSAMGFAGQHGDSVEPITSRAVAETDASRRDYRRATRRALAADRAGRAKRDRRPGRRRRRAKALKPDRRASRRRLLLSRWGDGSFDFLAAWADLDQFVAADRAEVEEQNQVSDGHRGRYAGRDLERHLPAVVSGRFDFGGGLAVLRQLGDFRAVESGDGREEQEVSFARPI